MYDEKLYSLYLKSFKNTNTIFELQNDEFLQDKKAKAKIQELKSNGIKICLDNIDSTADIKKFDLDFVKIKGDVVRLLHIDPNAISTCKEIISTCRELNIKTIASHINSQGAFDEAKKLGFDYFQGYYLGKPKS